MDTINKMITKWNSRYNSRKIQFGFFDLSSIIAILVLLTAPTKSGVTISAVLFVGLFCFHLTKFLKVCREVSLKRLGIIVTLGILSYFQFTERWIPSSKIGMVAGIIGMNSAAFVRLLWIVLFIIAAIEINTIVAILEKKGDLILNNVSYEGRNIFLSKRYVFMIGLISVVSITFFSKSSFLYPFNDWVDANCFFTVGKSLLKGKILYKDIYEHKGPLIYVLHAIASMISFRSFLGVYIFEIISCAAFLVFSIKICLCFIELKKVAFLIPIIATVTYSSTAFCHGDSVEEFFLPIITYSLYIGIQICMTRKIDYSNVFFVGIGTGIVLWTKYTSLGFYIGWVLVFTIYYITKKRIDIVLKATACYVGGVLCITLPVLLYFIKNDALKDLYKVYFVNNIVLYSNPVKDVPGYKAGWFYNVEKGIIGALQENIILGLLIIVMIIMLVSNSNKLLKRFISITILSFSIFVFKGYNSYTYYPLVFYSYLCIGMSFVLLLLDSLFHKKPRIKKFSNTLLVVFSMLCVGVGTFYSSNRYLLFKQKGELPQYKFAEIIIKKENATLLNYGFLDGGFYTVTGIVPEFEYFCKLNIPLKEMNDKQDEYLIEGEANFVVTCDEKIYDTQYKEISEAEFIMEGKEYLYRLYELNRS